MKLTTWTLALAALMIALALPAALLEAAQAEPAMPAAGAAPPSQPSSSRPSPGPSRGSTGPASSASARDPVSLRHPGHRRAADDVRRRRSARGPEARRGDRHITGAARRARRVRRHVPRDQHASARPSARSRSSAATRSL